jgi:imidazolonepropionase-like amidohydrolase
MSRLLVLLALLLPSSALAQARGAAEPTTAITHLTAHVGDGSTTVSDATVVLRGDRIVSVTAGGAAPSGATVIDGTGLVATPGLVATMTPVGVVEIELESSTMDAAPEGEADAIRAAFATRDGYNPLSVLLPVARAAGVTSVVSVPQGGLVPGTSCWADLFGRTITEAVRVPLLGYHVSLDDEGFGAEHGARPAAFLRIRTLFDEARLYDRSRSGYDRGAFPDTDVSRADLERTAAMLDGELRLVVRVSRADDILRVLELAEAYDVEVVLAGVEEGWVVAREIAAARVPVIVRALADLPTSFSTLRSRYDNAALLEAAGVNVSLMTPGAWNLNVLRQEAGNAVRAGMPWQAALAAVTSRPAAAFGQDDYGTLAAGKLGSVVLWSGDPFETSTVARRVFVRGHELPLRTRMTELFERYRHVDAIEHGLPGLPTEASEAATPAE